MSCLSCKKSIGRQRPAVQRVAGISATIRRRTSTYRVGVSPVNDRNPWPTCGPGRSSPRHRRGRPSVSPRPRRGTACRRVLAPFPPDVCLRRSQGRSLLRPSSAVASPASTDEIRQRRGSPLVSAAGRAAPRPRRTTVTQYLLSMPHDSAEEPTMATMDPAELEATLAVAVAFLEELQVHRAPWSSRGACTRRRRRSPSTTPVTTSPSRTGRTRRHRIISAASGRSRHRTGRPPSTGPPRHPRRSMPGSRSAPSRRSRPRPSLLGMTQTSVAGLGSCSGSKRWYTPNHRGPS